MNRRRLLAKIDAEIVRLERHRGRAPTFEAEHYWADAISEWARMRRMVEDSNMSSIEHWPTGEPLARPRAYRKLGIEADPLRRARREIARECRSWREVMRAQIPGTRTYAFCLARWDTFKDSWRILYRISKGQIPQDTKDRALAAEVGQMSDEEFDAGLERVRSVFHKEQP